MTRSTAGRPRLRPGAPRGIGALAVASFVLATPTLAAPPDAPSNCRAIPDYSNASILVEWNDVTDETGYRLFRAEYPAGAFAQIGPDLPADTVSFVDETPVPALDYRYTVRSLRNTEESPISNIFRQNVRVVWPNEDGRALLHNWNEVLGRAGSRGRPFHRGCDIQQTGAENDRVVFPRGGVVERIGGGGIDDNFIFVRVVEASGVRYDSFNHLDGDDAQALGFEVGDIVRAGQALGRIGDEHFTPETLDWVDHVHFFVSLDSLTNDVDGQHPLKIFDDDALRDPFEVRPRLYDHASPPDGTVKFHRQGGDGGEYLSLPIHDNLSTPEDEADVDIHVEVADDMNGGLGTTLAPTSISYWIQGPRRTGFPPSVKNSAEPYMLLKWDDRFFGFETVELEDVVDVEQNLAPFLEHDGIAYPYDPPPEFGWDNYKHFVATNTKGVTGDPHEIDATQYWNTNARDDGSAATSDHANFAGFPDATRAQDARFADGDYSVHIRLTDLIGASAERIEPLRLENYLPALARKWVTTESLLGDLSGRKVLHLEFSEPMLLPMTDSAITVEPIGGESPAFDHVWDEAGYSLKLIATGPIVPGAEFRLAIDARKARDLSGKGLDGEFGSPAHDGVLRGPSIESVEIDFTFETPAEVVHLQVDRTSTATALSWTPAPGASSYSISRALLAELSAQNFGDCWAKFVPTTTFKTSKSPAPGIGYAYLVQGVNGVGLTGSLGTGAFGERRQPGSSICP